MPDPQDIRTRVNRGLGWIGLASALVGVLDIIARFTVLRNFITPEEYGLASWVVPFFPVLDIITDMGMSAAVVQRDDLTKERLHTVFWLNFGLSLAVFALLLGIGPLWGWYFGAPVLGAMLITYGAKLIWQNVYFIPSALMRREFKVKQLQLLRIIANCAEFGTTLAVAYNGFGIWCFVFGPLARVFVTGVGTQILHPWRPKFYMKLSEAKEYVRFGFTASASEMLFHIYTNLDFVVVGQLFGKRESGLYKVAYDLVLEPLRFIKEPIAQLSFSGFARLKGQPKALVEQFLAMTRLHMVILLVLVLAVFLSAEDIIRLTAGPEYLDAAPAARMLCAVGVFRAMSFVVPPMLDGLGYPQRTLRYTAVAAILLPLFFILLANFGAPYAPEGKAHLTVALGWVVGYPVAFAALLFMALHLLDMRFVTYARTTGGILACAAAGLLLGGAAHWLLVDAPVVLRLGATTVVALGTFGGALATFQGLSPRTVIRAVRGG